MSGEIGVESEPGMGSSFWITMPALEGVSAAETPETERTVAPSGHNLLILTHDAADRATFERLLSPFGNRLTFAENLAQAAAMSARGDFTLILAAAADVNMLAATPGQRTPILALTANYSDTVRQQCHNVGMQGFLSKPVQSAELWSVISQNLS